MVQTREGAQQNDWITYMRTCAANYHAAKALEGGESYKTTRRVKGKPKVHKKARSVSYERVAEQPFSPARGAR